jgi:response regulator RpfG family c-di-GMP phosphodiesterase
MTAHAMAGDRERCLAAGMDHYISKPLEIPTLVALLARIAAERNKTHAHHYENTDRTLAALALGTAALHAASAALAAA